MARAHLASAPPRAPAAPAMLRVPMRLPRLPGAAASDPDTILGPTVRPLVPGGGSLAHHAADVLGLRPPGLPLPGLLTVPPELVFANSAAYAAQHFGPGTHIGSEVGTTIMGPPTILPEPADPRLVLDYLALLEPWGPVLDVIAESDPDPPPRPTAASLAAQGTAYVVAATADLRRQLQLGAVLRCAATNDCHTHTEALDIAVSLSEPVAHVLRAIQQGYLAATLTPTNRAAQVPPVTTTAHHRIPVEVPSSCVELSIGPSSGQLL